MQGQVRLNDFRFGEQLIPDLDKPSVHALRAPLRHKPEPAYIPGYDRSKRFRIIWDVPLVYDGVRVPIR